MAIQFNQDALHAFRNESEMKEFYKWLKERIEVNGGKVE